MTQKSDISIIVPIYNAEKTIQKCVDSLLNQTKKELELILINDGSTDKTKELLESYKDKRIKCFHNPNQGIGKTRNFGIKQATSKYIMFVDSDDFLEKDTCEELYNKAEQEDSDLVICDFYKIYENGSLEEIHLIDFPPTTLKETPHLLNEINLAPWNKLYRKDLIEDIRFAENLKYEDTPFVAEALLKAKRITKVNQCLNYYFIRGNSETTVRDKRCFDILKIIDIIRKMYQGVEEVKPALDQYTVWLLTNYTIQQRVQKDINVGMEFIDEAFAYLKKEVPDYKKRKYYKNRGLFRCEIERSKWLSKTYCRIYHFLHKEK